MPVDVPNLLELVQQYSFLYDKSRKDFRDLHKKNNAWIEIAELLDCGVEEAKTRWRTLRERYVKENKIHETNTRSGQSQEDPSSWEWYGSMSFLNPHIKTRKTTSNNLLVENAVETLELGCQEYHFDESSSSLSLPSYSRNNTPSRNEERKRKKFSGDIDTEVLTTSTEMKESRTQAPMEDEDDVFCRAVACELRKITDVKEKQRRKAKIFLIAIGNEEFTV